MMEGISQFVFRLIELSSHHALHAHKILQYCNNFLQAHWYLHKLMFRSLHLNLLVPLHMWCWILDLTFLIIICFHQWRFKDIFQEVYEASWKSKYEAAGIWWVTELCDLIVSWICYFLLNSVIELVGMSTVLLMIWLHMLLKVMEAMSGHAKIMTGTYKVISWHKVCEQSSIEIKLIKWHFLVILSCVNKFVHLLISADHICLHVCRLQLPVNLDACLELHLNVLI